MSPSATTGPSHGGRAFVPDLCRVQAILILLISTQLVVILFALIRGSQQWIDWDYLGLVSLFAQWTVLSSAALICLLRRWLDRQPVAVTTVTVLLLVLVVVTGFTLLGQALLQAATPGLKPQWLPLSRNLVIATVITLMTLRYFYLQCRWQQQRQAQMDASLAALQARIQPHFLFNSMNSIASLIASDPAKAEEAVLDLCALFRASLRGSEGQLVPLEEEITLCRNYLDLERLRLGKRLQLDWQLDDNCQQQLIPPLTLQPLLENAIYHGIQPRPDGGTIRVVSWQDRSHTHVLVSNPLPATVSQEHQGHQMALANIRARLASAFNPSAQLRTRHQNGLFEATLILPRLPSSHEGKRP
ncbi:MAG: sensor histidine kinase [Halomonadaceae bacterium]|nr:MAG: sensor histidine kinase [Halomonadaceae bacterium]